MLIHLHKASSFISNFSFNIYVSFYLGEIKPATLPS